MEAKRKRAILSDKKMKFKKRVQDPSGHGDCPDVCRFTLDRDDAEEIMRLALLARDNRLVQVERLDSRPRWLDGKSTASTDCGCLVVSSDSFWFSACYRRSPQTFVCEETAIGVLARGFGLPPVAKGAA